MSSLFSFGEPYKSAEEASKAKRSALLALCVVIVIQTAFYLFFWWITKFDNSMTQDMPSPHLDILLLLIFGTLLYLYNSRIIAGAFVALATLELVVTWAMKYSIAGNINPPGMALVLFAVAAQIGMVVFKTHDFIQKNNAAPPRSKWVKWALIGAFVVSLIGFFYPAFDFLNHTRYQISITQNGDMVEYYEPADKYSLTFPSTWTYEHPGMEYGNVDLAHSDNPNVTIQVERWQPWSIAPVALFTKEAFLKMAQDEAAAYSSENDVTIDIVESLEPSNINKARVAYSGADGSKRYVYYVYDKAWSRQTSDAAYFFWRITVDVPKDALQHSAEAEGIAESFKVNQ